MSASHNAEEETTHASALERSPAYLREGAYRRGC